MFHHTMMVLGVLGSSAVSSGLTVDFEELPAPSPDYFTNTGFTSKGVGFTGSAFAGWVYSDVSDTVTPGFGNQFAAFPGGGFGGSGNYGVGFGDGSFINLPVGQTPASVYLTNTTFAGLSMRDGDAFAKAFGGVTGDDPDFFAVTLTGYAGVNGGGGVTGTAVEFALADFRFADNSSDFIVDAWTPVDLSGLGAARSIGLTFASSDVGAFGINTPTYVALDNLELVPEPAGLLVAACAGLVMLRRREGA